MIPIRPKTLTLSGYAQVVVYLRWLRYLLDVTLRDKKYVILNVDETAVHAISQHKSGYVARGFRRQRNSHQHQRCHVDRSNTKTTLMGLICDQPHLQPYLPQVFMPKYTQNARPPHGLTTLCAQQGFPLQFWHGTRGSTSPASFKRWATEIRKTVHSFDDDLWILLVFDCHSSHLDITTVRHLHRLGFVTIVIPAKLTWLLQPLDVYVYAELKKNIRAVLAQQEADDPTRARYTGDWILPTSSAVRRVLCRTDWSNVFNRVGAGIHLRPLRKAVENYIGERPVYPELPRLRQFATLLNRVAHTDNTRALHQAFMQQAMRVRDCGGEQSPPRGERVILPDLLPAVPRGDAAIPVVEFHDVLRQHIVAQQPIEPLGGIVGDASVQVFFGRPPHE